ncbi:MAG: MBL fold metallo-hydrolase [Candidatus Thalassarchaeaceae archaeon]|tara:strand:- start:640 stop:2184 length:1545 start_codon:yes stop_codon:yes gene_type:complete
MDEAPTGIVIPKAKIATPRDSTSILISRNGSQGPEVLLAHRIPTLRAFADFWSLPGGGIRGNDEEAATFVKGLDQLEDDWPAVYAAILRETAEEVGLAIGDGEIERVSMTLRHAIIEDPTAWTTAVTKGVIPASPVKITHIGTRTTPPFSPLRFRNRFMHVHLNDGAPEPELLDIGSEFDELQWMHPAEAVNVWKTGNMLTAPPIITLLRDVAESLEVNNNDIHAAMASMAAEPKSGEHRIELAPNIECIPLRTATLPPSTHTNCFILGEHGGERLIVDPAARTSEELAYLQRRIRGIEEDGGKIIATIFTHRHQDHIGDLTKISEMYTAPIWATPETLASIPLCESDQALSEGDIITLNGPNGEMEWTVHVTPGHCPGHICLSSNRYLVSGDLAVMVGTILIPSSDGDMDAYIDSLQRMRALNSEILFPAHGPFTHRPEKLLDRYIKHRSGRHERVLEAVASGLSSIEKIANHAYSDTPDAHPMLKVDQTLSHLSSHESAGLIRREKEKWVIN